LATTFVVSDLSLSLGLEFLGGFLLRKLSKLLRRKLKTLEATCQLLSFSGKLSLGCEQSNELKNEAQLNS